MLNCANQIDLPIPPTPDIEGPVQPVTDREKGTLSHKEKKLGSVQVLYKHQMLI